MVSQSTSKTQRERNLTKALPWSGMHFKEITKILDSLSSSVFASLMTPDGRLAYANSAALHAVGRTLKAVIGKPVESTPWFAENEASRAQFRQALDQAATGAPSSMEFSYSRIDGREQTMELTLQPLHGKGGKVICIVTTAQDITERRQIEHELGMTHFAIDRAQLALFQVAPDGYVRDVNESASRLLGYPRERLRGLAVSRLSKRVARDDWDCVWELLKSRGSLRYESAYWHAHGHEVPVEVAASYIKFGDEEFAFAFVTDITERKRAEDHIRFLAHFDTLTGLPNRASFLGIVSRCLEHAAAEHTQAAVMVVDIERFWTLNDTLGRSVADELLRNVAERFSFYGEGQNRFARLGADQFGVVIAGIGDEQEVVQRIKRKISACFGKPFVVGEHEVQVCAKFGVTMFPRDGTDAESLMRNAEAALMTAKQASERYTFFSRRMARRNAERLKLELRLLRALERNEFLLHYQPKVNLQSGSIAGVEALLRWQDQQEGLVPPVRFIPLLEESGLIVEVGAWALQQARQDYQAWLGHGLAAPRISVNLSPVQLRRHDFLDTVRQALGANGGHAGVDVEITETVVMEDIERNIERLDAIRRMGISIAIDDFGTGYSSLAYLTRLPAQTMKVDRSFVAKMLEDENTHALVAAIIGLAHTLRLGVVAEGVETEAQAAALRELGCDEAQGYLYSRPLPADQLIALLKEGQLRPRH